MEEIYKVNERERESEREKEVKIDMTTQKGAQRSTYTYHIVHTNTFSNFIIKTCYNILGDHLIG